MRSHFAITLPSAPPPEDAVERSYHERGERAPWERVWLEGRDITDEDPSTWPWPWSKYYALGWRPIQLTK